MAASVTVAVVGARDIAKELGKQGTRSDITLYNSVRDGHAATLVEPAQFPEKLPPLLYALAMADRILFVVASLTREVAETAATVDLFDAPVDLLLGAQVGAEELRRAFSGTRLASAPMRPLDLSRLREEIDGWASEPMDGPVLVRIDHAFPVKGVGAVALGLVARGALSPHARLRLFPTPKSVEVRSVQVHDVDVPSAAKGERVGVALKGVDADELARGQLLAPEGTIGVTQTITTRFARRCPYYRGRVSPGAQLHFLSGLQLVPTSVIAAEAETVELETDRPVALDPLAPAILADLDAAPGPRVVGRLALPS